MVAIGNVVVTEPNRRAVGDRLVYTADDARYYLTGKSPSIFDAEHGTVWGDSLTFYNHDDRVLVESKTHLPYHYSRSYHEVNADVISGRDR